MRSISARVGAAGTAGARLAACALVVATALTGASTGPAAADDGAATGSTATTRRSVPVGSHVVLESPSTAEAYPYESSDGQVFVHVRNKGTTTVDSYTLTLDITSLQGIADVTSCPERAGHIIVCRGGQRPLVPAGSAQFYIGLRRAKGATVGASGEIRMTVESDGVLLASQTIKVTVPDAGLVPDRLERTPDTAKVQPGTSMKVTSGFTNYSATARNSTVVLMNYSGVMPDEEFSNCEYGIWGDSTHGGALARCVVAGPVDVNGSYDLDPVSVTADAAVLSGELRVSFGYDYQWGRNRPHHRGTGGELKLAPRPASAPPGKPQHIEGIDDFAVDNTMDIQAVGTSVQQRKARNLVTATVGVRNNGPAGMEAWTGSEPGEDPPYETHVYLPAGTEAVTIPRGCIKSATRRGVVYYNCFQDVGDLWIDPGQYTSWTFELRVVDPAALKPGRIEVGVPNEDPDAGNNTAAIVVRATDTGAGPGAMLAATASAIALLLGAAMFLGLRRRRKH